jgi:hypothetical protein
VGLGNPPALQLQSFTIEAWIKRASSVKASESSYLSGAILQYGWNGYGFALRNEGRLLLTKVGVDVVYSTRTITDTSSFHHVAVTKSGSTVVFYIDGVPETVGPYDPGFLFNSPVTIGASMAELLVTFLGWIDEVSVYNRPLSGAEIGAIYAAGVGGKCMPANACALPPPGLLAWWRGDGNAEDSVGKEDGMLMNAVTFVPGRVGQGFFFNGIDSYVRIPHSPSLSLSRELTVELWFQDQGSAMEYYDLIAKRGADRAPCNFGLQVGLRDAPGLGAYINDPVHGAYQSARYPTIPSAGQYHHAAGTFKQVDSGHVEIRAYLDGAPVSTARVTANLADALNAEPVTIGACNSSAGMTHFFRGIVDEVALYNRALSDAEIQAIYAAGDAGKCKSPLIRLQPTSQLGFWGKSVTFEVMVASEDPPSYQWNKDGAPIAGATNAILTLTNLQFVDAGSYQVVVSNGMGTVTSDQAVLTVNPAGVSLGMYAGVTIDGVVGLTYGVQYTTDLSNTNSWRGLANVTLGTSPQLWFDLQSVTQRQRFYQVVPGPITVP